MTTKKYISNIFWISLICVTPFAAKGQDTLLIDGIQNITVAEMDSKGNYYIADEGQTLYKLTQTGEIITNVNVKLYGAITQIDVSNPFEIYTYHREQNILVYYDNMLNVRGETRLNSVGFTNISALARSFDNGFWAFDLMEFKLLRCSKNGTIKASSNNLINILQLELAPYKIIEHNKRIYLCDSVNGVLVFDIFGTYIKTIHSSENDAVFVSEDLMYICSKGTVLTLHLNLKIPIQKKSSSLKKNSIFAIDAKSIHQIISQGIVKIKND